MNWKIIIRNGFIGAVLIVIPIMIMPYLGAWLSKKMESIIPFCVVLLVMSFLVYFVLASMVPTFNGYTDDQKGKKFQIGFTRLTAILLFIISLWILVQSDFYKI